MPLKNNINNKKGFTIIEVVLVLAVAGLIFLMVFLALPAMQRSQKNTQRKNDLSRLSAAVNEYQSNNRNKVPDVADANVLTKFLQGYLGADKDGKGFSGPNNDYTFKTGTCATTGACSTSDSTVSLDSGDDVIVWYVNAICSGADDNGKDPKVMVQPAGTKTALTRKLAFVVKMDGSNADNGSLYCVNN